MTHRHHEPRRNPVRSEAFSRPSPGRRLPPVAEASGAGVFIAVAAVFVAWLCLGSTMSCKPNQERAGGEPASPAKSAPPAAPKAAEVPSPPATLDLSAVTSSMGKERAEVERALGKPVGATTKRRASRVTCPNGHANDIYFRCKIVEYQIDYQGYRFDVTFQDGRLVYAILMLDRLPPELKSEELALRAFGIEATRAPVGTPTVALAWRACNGNSIVSDSQGAPLDFTFFRNKRGGGHVELRNNYTVPKNLKVLGFDEAMRLME